jgi:hypothetical protein
LKQFGLAEGINEQELKDLSRWPHGDCLNIWIVHNIWSNNQYTIFGSSTFPGESDDKDGIILRSDIVGSSNHSKVLTHEVGHYLNLYHTYQGGNETLCPPNSNCEVDGDHCCDTSPHKMVVGGCDTSGNNSCGAFDPTVVNNYMNVTQNSCKDRFTTCQVIRMRRL